MPVHNADIAALFEEMADLLEVEDGNPFRVRAYRNAGRTVEGMGQTIATLVEQGDDLTALPGIGKDLAAKITEIAETGKLQALDQLREKLPADITRMLKLPGLGPKRVKTLYHELSVHSMEQLKDAAQAGQVSALPGFGKKTEQQILEAATKQADTSQRFLRAATTPYVEALLAYLSSVEGVSKLDVAGSYRRARDTVGDLDILAVASAESPVMERFKAYDEVTDVLVSGKTKTSVSLRSGVQVDLRVVPAESFGAALLYFTGSKEHNIALRRLAQKKQLKISEYGVFREDEQVAGGTEADAYEALGMAFIEPELREDRGEVDAAREGRLPRLVEARHIKGDLHMHTTASDGRASIAEMAEAARSHGYDYIAITEHSKRLTIANGLDEDRLRRQIDEIDELSESLQGIRVLKGIEVDILEDGSLDLSEDVLSLLDLVIGSVHSRFNLPREKQTERILRAMDNAFFTILGHPTGRLVLERDPYDVDVERLVAHAAERGCFLELNANPHRLDLTDIHCRMARDAGVLVSIDTDAHRTTHLDYMPYGVGQARRGWLERKDVLNTRTLKQLLPLLKRTMG